MSPIAVRLSSTASTLILVTFLAAGAFAQTKTNWYNIDGWSACSSGNLAKCWQKSSSLAGGATTATLTGPTKTSSPSLDGSAARFAIGQNSGYADGIWWANTICCVQGISAGYFNFQYNLYFYIKSPSLSQALEFDVNDTISHSDGTSTRYVFGTQCNHISGGKWQVWSEGTGWVDTSISCKMPGWTWNHVVWEFQRTSDGQVYIVSLTFNGSKYYVNRKFGPRLLPKPADDLNAAFQMDTRSSGSGYSTWLDKVTLSAW